MPRTNLFDMNKLNTANLEYTKDIYLYSQSSLILQTTRQTINKMYNVWVTQLEKKDDIKKKQCTYKTTNK